ncbi:hypothetical protein [Cerasicoccus fimbriatus]|uniref:hypothetical protein n=1 Tax=Cerasicoccus fimbriatus TaxID=3014554 RepID=UPI0022B35FE0|nr:hypothetical protein [Cerasicoccus sp. TK19100]
MKGVDTVDSLGTPQKRDVVQELTALRNEIKALKSTLEDVTSIQAPLLGIQEVAKSFGKSPDTISRWVKDRVISCYKIPNGRGHVYLFSWKQLEEDLSDHAQPRL